MESERSDEPDLEALRSAIDESRLVLDHRIDLVGKMDDIAMHTLRTSVIIVGVLVSATGLAGPSAIATLSEMTLGMFALGLGCLFATILFGLATLTTSSLSFGVADAHRKLLCNDALDDDEWYSLLLREYGRWEREMESTGERNARWLYVVLWSFFAGIVFLAAGTGVMTLRVVW